MPSCKESREARGLFRNRVVWAAAALGAVALSLACAPKAKPQDDVRETAPAPPAPKASASESERPQCERAWTLTAIPGVEVLTSATGAWCLEPDSKPDSADFLYHGDTESQIFMSVGAACRKESLEEIIQMDLARLTSPGQGRSATASQVESLGDGAVLVYRYDDIGNDYYCRMGYQKVGDRCMLKYMICSHSEKLSEERLAEFRDLLLTTKVVKVLSEPSEADALAEARRRVQAAGLEAMQHVKYGGGDGTSYEKAVTIRDVENLFGCVSAQYAWLEVNRPACEPTGHHGDEKDGREYSVIGVDCGGESTEVYFDITLCEKEK